MPTTTNVENPKKTCFRISKYVRDCDDAIQPDVRSCTQIHTVAGDLRTLLYDVGPLIMDEIMVAQQGHEHANGLSRAMCCLCNYRYDMMMLLLMLLLLLLMLLTLMLLLMMMMMMMMMMMLLF